MENKSVKKQIRFTYSEEALKEALRKIRDGEISANKASHDYQIPKGTIMNKLKKVKARMVKWALKPS